MNVYLLRRDYVSVTSVVFEVLATVGIWLKNSFQDITKSCMIICISWKHMHCMYCITVSSLPTVHNGIVKIGNNVYCGGGITGEVSTDRLVFKYERR